MRNIRYIILGGILATTLMATVGCANATTSDHSTNSVPNQSSIHQTSSAVAEKTSTPIQFFIPQQLPSKMVLRTIRSSASRIELDYAPVGYNSMVGNTFWIQEVPNGQVSTPSKTTIQLDSDIDGYYDATPGKQVISQKRLAFIIPHRLTGEAPLLVSVRALNGSTILGKTQMIYIANQVISNVKMNVGVSR